MKLEEGDAFLRFTPKRLLPVVFVEVTDLPLLELGPAVTTVIKVTMLLFSIWLVRFLPTTVHFEIRTGHLQFLHFGDVAERISDVSVAVLYPGKKFGQGQAVERLSSLAYLICKPLSG